VPGDGEARTKRQVIAYRPVVRAAARCQTIHRRVEMEEYGQQAECEAPGGKALELDVGSMRTGTSREFGTDLSRQKWKIGRLLAQADASAEVKVPRALLVRIS
jgi:hypothetical protein